MRHTSEKGEGKLGGFIWLAVAVAAAFAAWNIAPVYIDNESFKDKLNEIARTPRYRATDEKIMETVMKEVRERRLDPYIARQQIQIITVETSRRILCNYERTVEVLPSFKKTFKFNIIADQPLV
jgi:hypothetical protein